MFSRMTDDENNGFAANFDLYDYKLIKFVDDSEDKSGEIDIVLKDWIFFNPNIENIETLFPPPPYNSSKKKELFKRLNEKSDAASSWKSYPVVIVGHASMFIILKVVIFNL